MMRCVLVVDDADDVRAAIVSIFEDLGFDVLDAASGPQALSLLRDPDIDVSLLFTDVQMPGMDGQQLAAEALKLRPALKIIFTSGFTGKKSVGEPFIAKPFRRSVLSELVSRTLAR
jgi:CheY-like chemotaxis protein